MKATPPTIADAHAVALALAKLPEKPEDYIATDVRSAVVPQIAAALPAGATLTADESTWHPDGLDGGTITVDTGANALINQGLLEAVGGMLTLRGVVDSTSGGTVAALNNAGAASGFVLLDGGTLRGGTLTTDTNDSLSILELAAAGGTLEAGPRPRGGFRLAAAITNLAQEEPCQ